MRRTDNGGGEGHRFGLAVAHPGHELRLTRWIEQRRPVVFVLTSGSRSGADRTRVTASRDLVETLGARPGGLFGACLDRDVYGWIMAGEVERFTGLAQALADQIVAEQLDAIVTDAWQLYNVTHDLWHLVTRAAAARASERLGRTVRCFDYPVTPPRLSLRDTGPVHAFDRLDAEQTQRKVALAEAFPAIAGDLAEVLDVGGMEFVGVESLHLPLALTELPPRPGETALYEQFGEARVRAGLYGRVLRWRQAEPIAAALCAMTQVREAVA
jgi:hypothetical protein